MNKLSIVTAAALAATVGGIAVAPQASASTSTLESRALAVAKTRLGDPYARGGAGPTRFDCSGLTQYSFKRAGKSLPRTAQGQYNATRHIPWQSRRPGDLVAVGYSSRSISHVGLYAGFWSGKSWMINANSGSYRGYKVVYAPINEYLGGGRHAFYAHP